MEIYSHLAKACMRPSINVNYNIHIIIEIRVSALIRRLKTFGTAYVSIIYVSCLIFWRKKDQTYHDLTAKNSDYPAINHDYPANIFDSRVPLPQLPGYEKNEKNTE